MEKKAQLEIHETILVIFIFIILLLVGITFFYRFSLQSIENIKEEHETAKFNELVSVIPNMAEIKCSHLTKESKCIDVIKLSSFVETSKKYKFGFKNITIIKTYPENINNKCTRFNFISCNYWDIYFAKKVTETRFIISTPVSLYYPNEDKYEVGKLIIERYP